MGPNRRRITDQEFLFDLAFYKINSKMERRYNLPLKGRFKYLCKCIIGNYNLHFFGTTILKKLITDPLSCNLIELKLFIKLGIESKKFKDLPNLNVFEKVVMLFKYLIDNQTIYRKLKL